MNHPSARLAALLVTVGLLGAGQVRADFTNWSYTWSMQPSSVISSGTGSVTYAVSPGGTAASNINVASITSTSSATGTSADSYNAPYTLTMKITDGNNQTGSLVFNGTLAGSVNSGQSSLVNSVSNATQTTTFDGHTYSLTLALKPSDGSVGAPGAAASTITGVMTVDGSSVGGGGPSTGPPPSTAPEPSALVLAGMACSACGLGGWLRRMRQRLGVA
jgi:hypothetical protein